MLLQYLCDLSIKAFFQLFFLNCFCFFDKKTIKIHLIYIVGIFLNVFKNESVNLTSSIFNIKSECIYMLCNSLQLKCKHLIKLIYIIKKYQRYIHKTSNITRSKVEFSFQSIFPNFRKYLSTKGILLREHSSKCSLIYFRTIRNYLEETTMKYIALSLNVNYSTVKYILVIHLT